MKCFVSGNCSLIPVWLVTNIKFFPQASQEKWPQPQKFPGMASEAQWTSMCDSEPNSGGPKAARPTSLKAHVEV